MTSFLGTVASLARQTAGAIGTAAGEVGNLGMGLTVVAVGESVGTPLKTVNSLFAAAKKRCSPIESPSQTVIAPCLDPSDIFDNAYRRTLIDSEVTGAGSAQLREAMEALSKKRPPQDAARHLETIARERGRPLDEITKEYDRYLAYAAKAAWTRGQEHLEPIDQLLPSQSDFMASNWQLRYGKVVGDRFGMDPVFGSMLNPTGGLVGPGNKGKAPDAWYMPEAVAYHGAYHDAMGYLYNYHHDGPGYNYLESPIGFAKSNPLAGQSTGIAQWNWNLNTQ